LFLKSVIACGSELLGERLKKEVWFPAIALSFEDMDRSLFKETIYEIAGVSKQAYHQQIRQRNKINDKETLIIDKVIKFRKRHSKMGSRMFFLF